MACGCMIPFGIAPRFLGVVSTRVSLAGVSTLASDGVVTRHTHDISPWLSFKDQAGACGKSLRAFASTAEASQSPPASSPSSTGSTESTHSSSTSSDSEARSSDSSTSSNGSGWELVYTGNFAKPHQRLKLASLVNSLVSLAASPVIVTYSEASPLARVGVAVSVAGFGVFTTLALHWFTSPYVHALHYDRQRDRLRASTINILGRDRLREFNVDEVVFPNTFKPLATFKARGRTYYLERQHFPDAELLQRLTPVDPQAAELERMQQHLQEHASKERGSR